MAKILLLVVMALSGIAAHATPVTWNLQGVNANGPMDPADVYGDGDVNYPVTGSFVYDADTNTYSSVNIVTAFRTWTDANLALFVQSAQKIVLIDTVTGEGMNLSFPSPLTNAGGTITLQTGFTFVDCVVSNCGSVEGAEEGPQTWTLNGVTTDRDDPILGPRSWTGSFDWVPSSNYSNINILTEGFDPFDTISTDLWLSAGCIDPATDSGVTTGIDAGGFTIFCMDFVTPLTRSGGTISLDTTPADGEVAQIGYATVGYAEAILGGTVSAPPVGGPYYYAGAVTTITGPVDVGIDIQSGYAGNALHPHHDGSLGPGGVASFPDDVVSVSVLGSLVSAGDPVDFDTDDIDASTLAFGPGAGGTDPGTPAQFNQNVDADGIDDATFGFLMSDSGISCGETSAQLTGETTGGQPFQGSDSIVTNCDAVCHN